MKFIVYERNVCEIICIKKNYMRGFDYYFLRPLSDSSLKICVPVNSKYLRDVISYDDALKLIDNMKSINVIENEKIMENEYKRLLDTGDLYDLVKIIKTTFLRNKDRIDNKKRISEKDDLYFNKAEFLLYSELGIALNMSYDEVKEYIINYLAKTI